FARSARRGPPGGGHFEQVPGGGGRAEPGRADRLGGRVVQADAQPGGDGPVDGGGDQGVDERQAVAAVVLGQDPARAQPLGRLGGGLAPDHGQGGGEFL